MGLLTNPACDGSMAALLDAAVENAIHNEETNPAQIERAYWWQRRDLDRLQADGSWGSKW